MHSHHSITNPGNFVVSHIPPFITFFPQQEINGCKDGWQLLLWQLFWGLVNVQLYMVWFIFRSQDLFQVILFIAQKLVGSVTTTAFFCNDSSQL